MDANEFLNWIGIKLQSLVQIPNESYRFEASQNLINSAISELVNVSTLEQRKVFDALIASHQTRMIGEFQVPFDDRDKFDTIEAFLATLEGYLEDVN